MPTPVFAAEARAFNLQGMGVRLWPSTIYRSVLRRSCFASVITCCTAVRETRNSFAIAAGPKPASKAARINRSCPAVTVAALSGFARAAFSGARFGDRPASFGASGALRPRRRSSSATGLRQPVELGFVQHAQGPDQVGQWGEIDALNRKEAAAARSRRSRRLFRFSNGQQAGLSALAVRRRRPLAGTRCAASSLALPCHTFTFRILAFGESLPMIGYLLGHIQFQTTRRYAHLANEVQKASDYRVEDSNDTHIMLVNLRQNCGS